MPTTTAVPPRRAIVVGLQDRLGQADHLERVVGAAAAGERPHLLDRIAVGGIDQVGGAELLRGLALHLDRVDGEDPRRAGDARALEHRLADAAAADDGDGRARLDLRGVERGAHAGGDATADERELLGRQVGLDLHAASTRRSVISSAKVPSPVMPLTSDAVGRACPSTPSSCDAHPLAQLRLVVQAEEAVAARGHERRDDPVAACDPRARRCRPRARCRRPRGRGSAACPSAPCPWRRSRRSGRRRSRRCAPARRADPGRRGDLFDHQRLVVGGEDGCSHVPPGVRLHSRAGCRIRTDDIFFTREVLCHLS